MFFFSFRIFLFYFYNTLFLSFSYISFHVIFFRSLIFFYYFLLLFLATTRAQTTRKYILTKKNKQQNLRQNTIKEFKIRKNAKNNNNK